MEFQEEAFDGEGAECRFSEDRSSAFFIGSLFWSAGRVRKISPGSFPLWESPAVLFGGMGPAGPHYRVTFTQGGLPRRPVRGPSRRRTVVESPLSRETPPVA